MSRTRVARPEELERVAAFYRANGYGQAPRPVDVIVLALAGEELCGALRLCEEDGVLVLRGMRVAEPLQGRGIGTGLLKKTEELIRERACWCIAHRHLESFYGRIGFSPAEEWQVPLFLRDRCTGYRRDHGLEVVIMHRPEWQRPAPDHSPEPGR